MEDTEKDKQQYLFQEIIEKSYDPELFQEFLLQAKPGGDELTKWSFDELKEVVVKFQKKVNKDEPQEEKEEEELDKRKSIVDEYLEFDDTMTNKSRYEDSGPSTQDSTSDTFNYIIRCNQLNPSELLKIKDVPVYVTKFEKKEGGIFEQSYVSYFINTPTLKKTVERRYSDF